MSRKLLGAVVATMAITATLATGAATAGAAPAGAPAAKTHASSVVSSTNRLTPAVARMVKGVGPAAEQKALASY
jgi:hypothetical protein